jgi:hypothetical protein
VTVVQMHQCNFCDAVANEMGEGVVRLTDNINEVRFDMCDDCLQQYLGSLPLRPRRGRAAQAAEQAAAA